MNYIQCKLLFLGNDYLLGMDKCLDTHSTSFYANVKGLGKVHLGVLSDKELFDCDTLQRRNH